MSHTTPVYALPYPDETDSADVPRDIQALAQRIEAVLPNVGVPPGMGGDWYATVAPAGFLLCDGSAISRTTYATLFGVIGTTWGGGDGVNTFNLPDTRGRVLVGLSPGGAAEVNALGLNDGTAPAARRVRHSHTNSVTAAPSHNLSLPAHAHADNISFADAGHYHGGAQGGIMQWNDPNGSHRDPGAGSQFVDSGTTAYAYASLQRSGAVGNPTSVPAINGAVAVAIGGTVGTLGATVDAPSYVVVAKIVKT
jgi:microcystin-dependent protein